MDTYLDRIVFPFTPNFASPIKGEYAWDEDFGGSPSGAEIDLSKWTYGKRKIEVSSVAKYGKIKSFFAEVRAAVCGFWLPYHNYTMKIIEAVDASNILVAGTDVAERDDPCKQVWLLDPSGNKYYAEITDQTVVGQNTLLTFSESLEELPTSKWAISPLYYVRLASDDISIKPAGKECEVTFSCIEQPHEYANPKDSSTSPIYLYEIGYILGEKENMERFTSWGTLVQGTDNTTWDPRPIYHDDINRDAEGAETSLECVTWTDCPFKDLFPKADGLPLTTRIYETSWDWQTKKEAGTRQLLIQSDTRTPEEEGRRLSASLMDGFQANDRSVPVDIKTRNCQVPFCSAKCGLNRSLFCVEATVKLQVNSSLYYVDIDPVSTLNTSRLEFGLLVSDDYHTGTPSKYWAWQPIQGYASLGDGTYRIQIRQPFNRLSIGDTVWVYYGCNHSVATCKAYNNFARFKASPNTPLKDPKINTETYTSTGKKG